ncbi:MAG: uroporphyrinogen-III decarboxylase-like protein [Firmicutes bacterium]|nr:uroporphyrinogen-III decarboxylase-like protein [Bacillota bacterium]
MSAEMTPRERWLAVLKREKPDRIPMDYWATPEATEKLMAHLGCETEAEMYRRLRIDKVIEVGPRYIGPPLADDEDVFGCRYRDVDYGTGVYRECVYHPLARFTSVEEIEAEYRWPSPDWWDYSHIAQQVEALAEEYPIRGGGSEPFLTYCHLRGQQQALMDLILYPEIVHYCLDRLFDLCYTNTVRILEQIPGKVMLTYVAEDMGSQEGLLFSPDHIREYLLPRMRRIIELSHEAGAYVFHHNDGAIREIIPELIDIGIDILNPIQWRCRGMDRRALKKDFGDKLIFHGGVHNQQTLVFGSPEDVRREVKENVEILGDGGGYILGPCHNIQSVSPPENIVAMYEAGYEYGRY